MTDDATGLTRRQALTRGAVVVGGAVYATPVVNMISMTAASAQEVSGNPNNPPPNNPPPNNPPPNNPPPNNPPPNNPPPNNPPPNNPPPPGNGGLTPPQPGTVTPVTPPASSGVGGLTPPQAAGGTPPAGGGQSVADRVVTAISDRALPRTGVETAGLAAAAGAAIATGAGLTAAGRRRAALTTDTPAAQADVNPDTPTGK